MKPFMTMLCLGVSSLAVTSFTDSTSLLEKCRDKQVPGKGNLLTFAYAEDQHTFYHAPEPWGTMDTKSTGEITCDHVQFRQQDTVRKNDKVRVNSLQFDPTTLLSQPYWSKTPLKIDRAAFNQQVFELARYSPILLISYMEAQHLKPHQEKDELYAIFSYTIHQTLVKLFIRKSDYLLEKVTMLHHDDMLGDISESIHYSDFKTIGKTFIPARIRIEKTRGVTDIVSISNIRVYRHTLPAVVPPEGFKISETIEKTPEIQVNKMGEHVYLLNLVYAETQVGLIEFSDFLAVIDAPLSSANGEMIIQQAKKIAPGKPIRYFGFGHHHAWYLGGVRPFIHKGVTILSTSDDLPYLEFIAQAPHTLQPDSLSNYQRPLLTEAVDSQKTIQDGTMEMRVYHIGLKSAHTKDYMIFYIPSEKLVFVDDLVWVNKEGEIGKASPTQAGFYTTVKELGLDVKTVVQCWPTGEQRSNKCIIPFRDIEQSMLKE